MIQYKKIMMTLVALLAVTTGAWADGTYTVQFKANGKTVTKENVALPHTFMSGNSEFDQIMNDLYGNVYTFVPESTYVASLAVAESESVKAVKQNGVWALEISAAFKGTVTASGYYYYYRENGFNYSIEISILTPAASSAFEVAWDKAKKTGTFTMPGGNVTLEPEYYPQAELTTGGAPTAIDNVPATTDGAIVKAGTVKNIGETTTAQGTVMYYVSQKALDDAALLALAADAWTADVPTAAHLAKGEAHVYYYVRGNDSNNDAENFSDGDILSANALTVTIAAEPTYAVTFKAANANTIEATQASKATVTVKEGTGAAVNKTGDITDGKLKAVKMGSEVKLEANPGYKFRKVEVKKGGAYEHSITIAVDPSTTGAIATAPAMTIEFNTGETWANVAARYDWLGTYETYTVYYKGGKLDGDVHDASGGVKPADTIDPNGSYHWGK